MHGTARPALLATLALASLAAGPVASADERWMTGDWNGARTRLLDRGIDLQGDYTAQLAGNLDGGFGDRHTASYLDDWRFRANLDLERLFGLADTDARITISKRNGRSPLSAERIADPRAPMLSSSVQSIYGYGDTWRLSHLWVRKRFDGGRVELKLGRLPMGDDLGTAGCDFQNFAFCGTLPGHGTGVWINYPVAQWGIQGRWQFAPILNVQAGAFEFNPELTGDHEGFRIDMDGRIGTMYVLELGWTPRLGTRGLAGNYRVGTYFNTAPADDVLVDVDGGLAPLTGLPPRRHDHRQGAGTIVRQQLTMPDPAVPERGLELLAHYTRNDRATARVDWQWQLALIWRGPFASRSDDVAGIGLSNVHGSDREAMRRALENDVDGLRPDDPDYRLLPRTEVAAELFYRWRLRPWLTVRPSLQYVGNPGGVGSVDDAWVLGFSIGASL